MAKFTIDKDLYEDYLAALKNPNDTVAIKTAKEKLLEDILEGYTERYTVNHNGKDMNPILIQMLNEGGSVFWDSYTKSSKLSELTEKFLSKYTTRRINIKPNHIELSALIDNSNAFTLSLNIENRFQQFLTSKQVSFAEDEFIIHDTLLVVTTAKTTPEQKQLIEEFEAKILGEIKLQPHLLNDPAEVQKLTDYKAARTALFQAILTAKEAEKEYELFDNKNNIVEKYSSAVMFLTLDDFEFPSETEVAATTGFDIEITAKVTADKLIDVTSKRVENDVKKPFKATLEAQKASKPFSGITKGENLFAFGKRLFTTAGMGFLGFKTASKLIKFMPVNNVVKAAVTALFVVLGNVLAGLYISSEKFTVDSQATGVKKFLGKMFGAHSNLFAKEVNSTSAKANAKFSTEDHIKYYQKIALDEVQSSHKKVSFKERVLPNELRENNNVNISVK